MSRRNPALRERVDLHLPLPIVMTKKKHHHLLYCHLQFFAHKTLQNSSPTPSHWIITRRASTSTRISYSNELTFTTPNTSIERDEFETPLSPYKPSISSTLQTLDRYSERNHTIQNLTLRILPVYKLCGLGLFFWIEILSRTNVVKPKGCAIEECTKGRNVEWIVQMSKDDKTDFCYELFQ